METFGRIWALKCTLLVLWFINWPKLNETRHFGPFKQFHFKKLKLIYFMVVLVYGVIWWNMSPSFLGSVRGSFVGQRVQKLVKLHKIWHFGDFLNIFNSKKEMNPFPCNTKLLKEYEHLNVLRRSCKGPLSWDMVQIGQFIKWYDMFLHFSNIFN